MSRRKKKKKFKKALARAMATAKLAMKAVELSQPKRKPSFEAGGIVPERTITDRELVFDKSKANELVDQLIRDELLHGEGRVRVQICPSSVGGAE